MKKFSEFLQTEANKMKGADPCWKGYEMIGKKKKNGREVPNCVPVKEDVEHPAVVAFASKAHEEWRKNFENANGVGTERIKKNSDGTSGNINVPFNKLHPDWQKENLAAGRAAKEAVEKHPNDIEKASEHIHNEWMKRNPKADYNAAQHVPYNQLPEDEKEKDRVHARTMKGLLNTKKEEVLTERGADSKGYYRSTESGAGLTPKGAKHFGIKTAVTTPPSKLKKGGKAWKRRKSFCARMSGMKGPMKDEKGRPTRKAMSLRRWNCN